MRELGPESEWWHRDTGRYVKGRADRLICVGPLGKFLGDGAIEAGFPASEVRVLDSPDQAANLLDSMLDAGDTVLFKASRGVGLEKAVEKLTAPGGAGRA
jgi:UDP-N-acetylmuramyl pentapeptide synthase